MSAEHFLTFEIDRENYGIDIGHVQSVLDFGRITKVPRTPDFMRGVINLRGKIVPIIDLRLKFGLTETERTKESCIIVVEIAIDGEKTTAGVLADAVNEVIFLESEKIEPPPRIGTHLKTEFIRGVAHYDQRLIILLDIEKIFSNEELTIIQESSGEQQAEKEAELADAD